MRRRAAHGRPFTVGRIPGSRQEARPGMTREDFSKVKTPAALPAGCACMAFYFSFLLEIIAP